MPPERETIITMSKPASFNAQDLWSVREAIIKNNLNMNPFVEATVFESVIQPLLSGTHIPTPAPAPTRELNQVEIVPKLETGFFVSESKHREENLSIEEIERSIDPVEMEKMQSALQTDPLTFQQHAIEEKGHWGSRFYPGSGKMKQEKNAPPPASAPLNNTVFNITNERLWNGIPRKKITRKQYESMSKETMYAASAVAAEALKRGESVERIHQLLDEELAKATAEKTE